MGIHVRDGGLCPRKGLAMGARDERRDGVSGWVAQQGGRRAHGDGRCGLQGVDATVFARFYSVSCEAPRMRFARSLY